MPRARRRWSWSNVYREMYRRVSEPFSRHVVADPVEGDPDAIDLQLTLWFRGHDTGHGVRLPETDFTAMRCEGRWLSMVMQEAMADVFGFLMSTAGPWTEVAPTADRGVAATIFLREMLRYLCRGGDDFPDAGGGADRAQLPGGARLRRPRHKCRTAPRHHAGPPVRRPGRAGAPVRPHSPGQRPGRHARPARPLLPQRRPGLRRGLRGLRSRSRLCPGPFPPQTEAA